MERMSSEEIIRQELEYKMAGSISESKAQFNVWLVVGISILTVIVIRSHYQNQLTNALTTNHQKSKGVNQG